jgi:uncharacterized protein YegP (UPF0339 family)
MAMKFQLYKDAAGEWRWRLRAKNGQVIATSGEGYKNAYDCMDMIRTIQIGAQGAEVERIDGDS